MAAPPQARPNTAQHADRNAKIFNLRVAGLTERQIAAEVELSQTRVHEILNEEIGARVGPAAEEYVTLREAELSALWKRAFAIMATAEDPEAKLKAMDRLVRINESRRRLRGADAPEAMVITEQRADEEASQLIVNTLVAVLSVLGLDDHHRAYALQLAAWELADREGDAPAAPAELEAPDARPALSGPYTSGGVTYIVHKGVRYERAGEHRSADLPAIDGEVIEETEDDADAVRAELAKFVEEFGPLEDEDGPEDDQAPAA